LKCHGNTWENGAILTTPIRSFAEFWPFYVRQHSQPQTRLLHAMGSVLAVILFGVAFAVNLWILIAVPVVGYSFAWYAHFFVEHNKPATFGHPFYSLAADYRMLFLMMAGRMDEEVAKHISAAAPAEALTVRP
jgi:hypothetical protein